jgi:LEA14-like dessication related protein
MSNLKQLYSKALTCARRTSFGSLLIMFCLCVGLGTGCTSLRPDFETPSVGITSFKSLSSQSIAPKFEIGMRVVNPNATQLNLRGMSYKIFLNDYEVVEGAANELPVVLAYGEAEFKVVATVGLIEGIQFVNGLLQNASGQVAYRLQTKLDVGAMAPAIRIEKAGKFPP